MRPNRFRHYIERIAEKLGVKKENILPFLFTFIIVIFAFLHLTHVDNLIIIIIAVAVIVSLTLIVLWIFMEAGFAVLKSLFFMGAEVSLLIFLSQSYCDAEKTLSVNDDALRSLIFISLAYITFEFFKSLIAALKKRLDNIPDKEWPWEKVVIVILFLLFTLSFIYMIYQVVSPIILNICIYKR